MLSTAAAIANARWLIRQDCVTIYRKSTTFMFLASLEEKDASIPCQLSMSISLTVIKIKTTMKNMVVLHAFPTFQDQFPAFTYLGCAYEAISCKYF